MNLISFAKSMDRTATLISKRVDEGVQRVALVADEVVVLRTPADTGAARSNWRASLGAPLGDVIAPIAPGSKLGLGERANAQAAINQAKGVIAARKKNQDIFITNNLDYIQDLDQGSSKQAPANFVELAIVEALNEIDNVEVLR